MSLLMFLGRRWQGRQAVGAQDSTTSTAKRRPRGIPPSSGVSLSRSPAPLVNIGSVGGPRA